MTCFISFPPLKALHIASSSLLHVYSHCHNQPYTPYNTYVMAMNSSPQNSFCFSHQTYSRFTHPVTTIHKLFLLRQWLYITASWLFLPSKLLVFLRELTPGLHNLVTEEGGRGHIIP